MKHNKPSKTLSQLTGEECEVNPMGGDPPSPLPSDSEQLIACVRQNEQKLVLQFKKRKNQLVKKYFEQTMGLLMMSKQMVVFNSN